MPPLNEAANHPDDIAGFDSLPEAVAAMMADAEDDDRATAQR